MNGIEEDESEIKGREDEIEGDESEIKRRENE